jgi:serine/threonine protein kinase
MEVVQEAESFKMKHGKLEFSYVRLFVQQDGVLYTGKWWDRFLAPKALEDLHDIKEVPTKDRGPVVDPTWSAAEVDLTSSAIYLKTPGLLAYINPNLETQIAREIGICEILRKNPHPNITTYYGYQETNSRVSALCFKRYKCSLLEAVNPRHLSKAAFRSTARELVKENMKSGLEEILNAIKHLHSLGLVYNDITPANIMLDDDGTLILIDFDSCRYIGESLRETKTKRTIYWHDASIDTSLKKNDLDAFKDLQIWLSGSASEEFVFK